MKTHTEKISKYIVNLFLFIKKVRNKLYDINTTNHKWR